jgi:S1-C subfamily serine protease
MRDLTLGERVGIDTPTTEINIAGPRLEALGERLGAVVVALDANRKIPSSFAPITLAAREMRPGAKFGNGGALEIEFAALPADVERLMLILYIVGGIGTGVTFLDFQSLSATVGDNRLTLDLTNRGEASLILVELYRHKGAWRLAANGQGFVGGIGAVASALDIVIDVPHPPETPHQGGSNYPPPPQSGSWSGSGFAIERRHIITNAHVVNGAKTIMVASERETLASEVVFVDPRNDIALLRVSSDMPGVARFRNLLDIHLGEDVVVLGFPLQGLLGAGPQATTGNVSSLCGMGNDVSVMQYTAPTASGNSGGPILDAGGLVVGQVHSSLNLDSVRMDGNRAENVNFGAKAGVIRLFLAMSGIEPVLTPEMPPRPRADVVREARGYIYRILCES